MCILQNGHVWVGTFPAHQARFVIYVNSAQLRVNQSFLGGFHSWKSQLANSEGARGPKLWHLEGAPGIPACPPLTMRWASGEIWESSEATFPQRSSYWSSNSWASSSQISPWGDGNSIKRQMFYPGGVTQWYRCQSWIPSGCCLAESIHFFFF